MSSYSETNSSGSGRLWRPSAGSSPESTSPSPEAVPPANNQGAQAVPGGFRPVSGSGQGKGMTPRSQPVGVSAPPLGEPVGHAQPVAGRASAPVTDWSASQSARVLPPARLVCAAGLPSQPAVVSAPPLGEQARRAAPGAGQPFMVATDRRVAQDPGVSSPLPLLTHNLDPPPLTAKPSSRGNKRVAEDSSSSPPKKKKNKEGKKSKKGKKDKGSKSGKKRPTDPPSEGKLMGMLQAFAAQQGWALTPPAGASSNPPSTGNTATGPAASMSPPAPPHRPSHPPAALGAPPGEETDKARTTPLYVDPPFEVMASPDRAWTDTDSVSCFSTRSGASSPTPTEAQDPPTLQRMGAEAQTLLHKYLPETYKQTGQDDSQASLLFRQQAPPTGIPLTTDFKGEYDRIAGEPPRKSGAALGRAFAFQTEDFRAFFLAEKLSPDTLAVGERVAARNPLRSRTFREEDARWAAMSTMVRSGMRLTAYMGALIGLNARAQELGISEGDRAVIDDLLLSLTGLQWSQLSQAAVYTTHRRREMTLQSLGVKQRDVPTLTQGLSCRGPLLFAGQFAQVIEREVASRKQAAEIAQQLRHPGQGHTPRPRKDTFRSPTAGGQTAQSQRRVTVTVPAPGPAHSVQQYRPRGGRTAGDKQRGDTRKSARGGRRF